MSILQIIGIIVLIAVAYNILKDFGVVDFIKTVIGMVVAAFLLSLAVGAFFSLFGLNFDSVQKIAFWILVILCGLKSIKGN